VVDSEVFLDSTDQQIKSLQRFRIVGSTFGECGGFVEEREGWDVNAFLTGWAL
jgi:hypothetical protein